MDANNGRLQLMWVVVSMVVVAIIMTINYNIIGRLWPVIYSVDVLLLGLVLDNLQDQRRQRLVPVSGSHLSAFRAGKTGADYHAIQSTDELSG